MKEDEEVALLREALDQVECDLARNLLGEAGIPCLVEGPDFDIAELGRSAHANVRGQSLYVPRSALERARRVLEQAWGRDEGSGPGEADA